MTVKLKVQKSIGYRFHPVDLCRLRESMGLSQAELADKCGWTQQYQSMLETTDSVEGRDITPNILRGLLRSGIRLRE